MSDFIVYKCPAKTEKQCIENQMFCPPGFCSKKPKKMTDAWKEVDDERKDAKFALLEKGEYAIGKKY